MVTKIIFDISLTGTSKVLNVLEAYVRCKQRKYLFSRICHSTDQVLK